MFHQLILNLFLFFCSLSARVNFLKKDSVLNLKNESAKIIFSTGQGFVGGGLKIPSTSSLVAGSQFDAVSLNECSVFLDKSSTKATGPLGVDLLSKTFLLQGNCKLDFDNFSLEDQVLVTGSGNELRGFCWFKKPITLFDSSAALTLALDSKLDSDLFLNGGSLRLEKDLALKDNVLVHGPGLIDCNGYSFILPRYLERSLDTGLEFFAAKDVTISTRTTLASTLSFTGNGLTSNLIGRGVVLRLVSGGSITIGTGHTLRISDLHIVGLGSAGGTINFSGTTSTAILSNCILDLNGTYTMPRGRLRFEGAFCKIITGSTEKFVSSGSRSDMFIDDVLVDYENVNQLPTYPISLVSSGSLTFSRGGGLRSNYTPGTGFRLSAYIGTTQGVNFCDSDIYLTSGGTLTFYNENIATAKTMILDCKNNTVSFGDGLDKCLIVQQNVTLVIRNSRIKNFDISKIDLQGSGLTQAKVQFENNVFLEFRENQTYSTNPINVTGTGVELCGRGMPILTLDSKMINFSGANAQLCLKNLVLKCCAYDSIKWVSTTTTTTIDGCDFVLTKTGLTIDQGNITFINENSFIGRDETDSNAAIASTLSFTTPGRMLIGAGSRVCFKDRVRLFYSPSVAGDGGLVSNYKRHIRFVNPSSSILFEGATLDCTPSGIAFDYGVIMIDQSSTFSISTRTNASLDLGTAANLQLFNASVLNVNGPMNYVPSTYP